MRRKRFNTRDREFGLPLRRPSPESFALAGEAESLLGELAARDVVRPNLDVHAQYALVRMSKGNFAERRDATEILRAVKAGKLAGIFIEDQRYPALKAQRVKMGWWELIPRGKDAELIVSVVDLGFGSPFIVFRRDNAVRSNLARMVTALRMAWSDFPQCPSTLGPHCPSCSIPVVMTEVEALDPVSNEYELNQEVDRNGICPGTTPLTKAFCEMINKVDNDLLIEEGQSYWTVLADRALQDVAQPTPLCKPSVDLKRRGHALMSSLMSGYLANDQPRTGEQLRKFFRDTRRRDIEWCDRAALSTVSGSGCFDTVGFMARLLRRKGAFRLAKVAPQISVNYIQMVAKVDRGSCHNTGLCNVSYSKNLPRIVEGLKKSLDGGHIVRAGIAGCTKWCALGNPAHYVLIIGYDGNQFQFWNTVSFLTPSRFGALTHDKSANGLWITPKREYPIISLESL